MSYIALSDKDKQEMLRKIGVSNLEGLFDCIPEKIRLNRPLKIPGALSETELIRQFECLALKNSSAQHLSFLGAGAYSHIIPTAVDYLSSRGEFVTPYTPYQPEVSQGTLQVIFEFQTLICQLTGMDIANASLYEGASGAAEAVLMANRLTRRAKILVPVSLHPEYRQVIRTYTRNLDIMIEEIGYLDSGRLNLDELRQKMDAETAAIICQSPNFFGIVEDLQAVSDIAHEKKALSIAVIAEPVSLGILKPPGQQGVDICTGEAQAFGNPLSFGGPYLGFMACAKEFIRQFPGRITGAAQDIEGKRGFVLTLSTREQHIRRERATSNICTNQALCAVRATIFLETLGKKGMRDLSFHNLQKARYALDSMTSIAGVSSAFSGPIFNEFVLRFEKPWEDIEAVLLEDKILGGLPLHPKYPELKNCALFCVTEMHSKSEIDLLASVMKRALQ